MFITVYATLSQIRELGADRYFGSSPFPTKLGKQLYYLPAPGVSHLFCWVGLLRSKFISKAVSGLCPTLCHHHHYHMVTITSPLLVGLCTQRDKSGQTWVLAKRQSSVGQENRVNGAAGAKEVRSNMTKNSPR